MTLVGRSAPRRGRHITALGALSALPIVGLIAACGGSAAIPAGIHRSVTTAATSAVTTPAATPAPAPPVVMVLQRASTTPFVIEAMDPSGSPLWSAPYRTPGAPEVYAAGSRVFEVDYAAKTVSVFDRTGHSIGSGQSPSGDYAPVFSPTSPEWAWSTQDSVSPSPATVTSPLTVTGSLWVAGVGEAAHRVYTWTEHDPPGGLPAYDRLSEWSDQGLVSSEEPPWVGCSMGHQSSSYIVDPTTGARTDLGSDAVVDVHAGLIVSAPPGASGQTPQAIVLSGRTSFTWTEPLPGQEFVNGVYVSPAGDRVGIALLNIGCAGQQPTLRTAIISVADHSVHYLQGALAQGWLDDTQLIAQVGWDTAQNANQELDVVGIDGARALLGHGELIGVLTSA